MKRILLGYLFIFLLPLSLFSQEKELANEKIKKLLHKSHIYLFCKGTTAKMPVIAKEFNWGDTNITHVGIGIFEKQQLVIYNVVNSIRSNALVKDSLPSFIEGNDISYCSIWEMENSKRDFKLLRKYLKSVQQKNIQFDFMFDLNNGDSVLYCSEFCQHALYKLDPKKYSFLPKQMELNNTLYETILNRKILTYFPVDFFEGNPLFKKIYEANFP
jgi:hypothetical protein